MTTERPSSAEMQQHAEPVYGVGIFAGITREQRDRIAREDAREFERLYAKFALQRTRSPARQIEIESAVDAVVSHAAASLDRRGLDALKRAAGSTRGVDAT